MTDCDYCSETFDSEQEYLEHLNDTHYDDLTRIDKKRVDEEITPSFTEQVESHHIKLALGIVILSGFLGILFQIAADTGPTTNYDGEITPTNYGEVHYHGTLDMTILGEPVDFSQSKHQLQSDYVHFENGNGEKWHVHGNDVTLGYLMATLGYDVESDKITSRTTAYADSEDDYNVTITVNGESVTPNEYVLQPEDHIEITVEKAS